VEGIMMIETINKDEIEEESDQQWADWFITQKTL
jgi:hypothetical protein